MHNKSRKKFNKLNKKINNNKKMIKANLKMAMMVRNLKIKKMQRKKITKRMTLQVNLTKKMKNKTIINQSQEGKRIKLKKCKKSTLIKMKKKDNLECI